MAKINLLPWRQAYRAEKKKQFINILIGIAILSALIAYLWISTVKNAIENQQARNYLLNTEIAKLDAQVKEITDIKRTRDDLLARIKVITDLEGTRPVIVRYFDEMVRLLPDGVWLTSVERKDNVVTIHGVAESHHRIAGFLRNIDDSEWYDKHDLKTVVASNETDQELFTFNMTVETSMPVDENAALQQEAKK